MNERDAKPAPDALGSVEQDRIVMLSDGVFAIAITLLVLDISLPNGVNSSDVSAIVRSLLPHFIGYTISFIVIASYWLGHRRIMKVMTHVDRNFLWLNFLFLFFISLFVLLVPYGAYIFFGLWAVLVPLLIQILTRVFLPRRKARKQRGN